MSRCQFLLGDVFDRMAELPDSSVDLIVTSPPFLALRSYLPADHPDKHKEIGSEATPAAFLTTLLALTREWRRILAPHGSIAIELGDTYSGSSNDGGPQGNGISGDGGARWRDRLVGDINEQPRRGPGWPLAKSLCLIPSLYAGSLAYGHNLLNPDDRIDPWRVRNLIVWHRPNPPVGALGDKVRPSTSYITTACTSATRWFDLDAERTAAVGVNPRNLLDEDGNPRYRRYRPGARMEGGDARADFVGGADNPAGAPPLDCWIDGDVWTIPTHPYKGAHYATYPPALPRRLINLMCPREVCTVCGEPRRRITSEPTYEPSATHRGGILKRDGERTAEGVNQWVGEGGAAASVVRTVDTLGWTDCDCFTTDSGTFPRFRRGVVLDPFAGSGTTLMAAAELGRDAIGIDLDPRNLDLARDRLGLFLDETPPTERATP